MRRNFDDGAKLWGKGGVQPKFLRESHEVATG